MFPAAYAAGPKNQKEEIGMNHLFETLSASLKFLKSRAFAIGALCVVLAFTVAVVSDKTKTVYIHDGEQVSLAFTTETDPSEILKEQGIRTVAHDNITFTGFDGNSGEIKIDRAFPVSVTADGNTQLVYMTDGQVKDALKQAGVTVAQDDQINLSLSAPVERNTTIVIKRVQYETIEEREAIAYETETRTNSLQPSWQRTVVTAGQEGERTKVYSKKIVDGMVQSTELVSDSVTKEPVNQVEEVGTMSVVSDLGTVELDANGVPVSYKSVMKNAVATAYSARAGAGTASGRPAIVGHVAVNPNVIPYGSKLYIRTPDGSYVYGYAVAADTGVALNQGIIDVDLFFSTYEESCQFGKKAVDIYILE